jgi:dCMP deaminase
VPLPPQAGRSVDWAHKALNRLIQGSAADQTKKAVVDIDAAGYVTKTRTSLGSSCRFTTSSTAPSRTRQQAEDMAHIMRNVRQAVSAQARWTSSSAILGRFNVRRLVRRLARLLLGPEEPLAVRVPVADPRRRDQVLVPQQQLKGLSMNWYVAARKQDWGRDVRVMLEAIGETVIARWLDATNFGSVNQTEATRTVAAQACVEDCMLADALVIVAEPALEKCKGGKHVEWGIMIGRGKPTFIIGGRENIFAWLPNVRRFESITAFVNYVESWRDSRPKVDKWDIRFLELADKVASWSKDPSTKTGAVIVDQERRVVSLGYNGFARGMLDTPALYADRETKYSRVVHCEMNAVMVAARPVDGCTLYTTPGPSCDRCAVHMIQAGIRRFVFWAPTPERRQRWNVDKTLGYFREVGADVLEVERP